ncbi:MAG TPA: hypothetical protein PKD85_07660 [Saprospiraceae bacterium]|nr:hypothetical protein [Saprospiraceae bacterium]
MNTYNLSSGLRTLFISMMVVGVLCLGITFITDDALHSRFWSNMLHNSVFFTGLAIMASFFIAASLLAYGGWYTLFKRVFEAVTAFLPYGLGLIVIIGIGNYAHLHHLYHWTDAEAVKNDPILLGKSGFLNSNFFMIVTVLFGGAYVVLINKIKSLSVAEDSAPVDSNFTLHRQQRFWAAILLPVIGFTSVIMIWQWIMSVDAHWYSTMFAWYTLASWFVAMVSLVTLILLYLRGNGYYQNLSQHHIHDMGKLIFAFSVFWTYLWFSQFMLIWYANVGEETIYFKERYDNYPVLFFANLAVNFVLPFIVLLRNDTKRKVGTLSFVAIIVFIFHWVDFFLMIKPGVLHTAHEALGHSGHDHGAADHSHGAEHVSNFVSGFTMPGLLEIGTMLGFLGLFCFIVFNALGKNALTPKNDPYLEESLHHHV